MSNATGAVLTSGTGTGTATFTPRSTVKVNLEVAGTSGAPRITEFALHAG